MSDRRTRRSFTEEFKKLMVQLYLNGKPSADIIKENDLTASSLTKWVNQFNNTKSFKEKDNMTDEKKN